MDITSYFIIYHSSGPKGYTYDIKDTAPQWVLNVYSELTKNSCSVSSTLQNRLIGILYSLAEGIDKEVIYPSNMESVEIYCESIIDLINFDDFYYCNLEFVRDIETSVCADVSYKNFNEMYAIFEKKVLFHIGNVFMKAYRTEAGSK